MRVSSPLMLLAGILLSIAVLSCASTSHQEDVSGRERRDAGRGNSPAQEFFYKLTNTARDRWGDMWSQDPPPSLQKEATEGVEEEEEERGAREDEEDEEEDEKEEERYHLDIMADFDSAQHDIFDIKRMKRRLQLKKLGNYQRSWNSKQRKQQLRKKQQKKKLMKTVARNTMSRSKKTLSSWRWKNKHRGRRPHILKSEKKQTTTERPNIILIVADDLGFNDVPWHNPDVIAPNLLRLARQGVLLENHYVLPLCTPSRAALLTGVYPFRYGKQTGESSPLSPTGLNTSITLLPQRLKNLGYSTHLIGKWHLGYCNWDYTPTRRGFDSFYGFYLGSQTYYTQFKKVRPKKGLPSWWDTNEVEFDHDYEDYHPDPSGSLKDLQLQQYESKRRSEHAQRLRGNLDQDQNGGRDFRFNEMPLSNVSGIYSNELYAMRAEEVIRAHVKQDGNTKAPLFMMLSMQAVHGPVEVPLKYRRKHTSSTKNLARRTFLGMVNALDDVIGRVVTQLKASGLYRNSVIVFTTDNGGNIQAGGNNFPLRGNKGGVFEGGTRGVAFVHSPLLPKSGYKYTGMMHIVDWHDTLLHVAQKGSSLPRGARWRKALLKTRDEALSGDQEEKRDSINMWPAMSTNTESPRNSFVYNVRKKPLRGAIRRKNWKLIIGHGGRFDGWVPPTDVYAGSKDPDEDRCCSTWHSRLLNRHVTLYNLKDDPLETTDVSYLNPDVTATLKSLLRKYASQSQQPHTSRADPLGHPSLHGGFFSPGWCRAVV